MVVSGPNNRRRSPSAPLVIAALVSAACDPGSRRPLNITFSSRVAELVELRAAGAILWIKSRQREEQLALPRDTWWFSHNNHLTLIRHMHSFNSSDRPRIVSSPLLGICTNIYRRAIFVRVAHPASRPASPGPQSADVAAENITMTPNGILAAAARFFRATMHVVQVEMHGQYSIERLRALHDYISMTPTNNLTLAAELLVTPLPCLAVILLLETIPLDPPSAGINANVGFMVQASVSGLALTLFTITMYEAAVPTLRLQRIQVVMMMVGTTIGMFLSCYTSAIVIGFPVPFLMTLTTPEFVGELVLFLFVFSVSHLRSCPSARASAKDWVKVFILMGSTMMVYPICNYAFEKASTQGQIAISLLMGCIKVAYKYTMGKCVRENGDLRAEIVNFHSEVPNALFVAFSMQSANSMLTIALFLAVDAIHSCTTLYDVHLMARRIARLEEHCRETSRLSNNTDPGEGMPEVSPSRPGTMIGRALDIVSRRTEQPQTLLPLPSTARSPARPNHASDIDTPPGWCKRLCVRKLKKIAPGSPSTFDHRILAQVVTEPTVSAKSVRLRRTEAPTATSNAENEYVDAVLRLLYMTEFVALAEMIEMVVPVIYGVYMAVMVHMPNRIYISSLATVDPADLQPVLLNMLAYGLVEFVSLFVMCAMLQRQLGFSPAAQLMMVLRTRWRSIQAALTFWLIVSVQTQQEHYGVDYSFQFAWLRK